MVANFGACLCVAGCNDALAGSITAGKGSSRVRLEPRRFRGTDRALCCRGMLALCRLCMCFPRGFAVRTGRFLSLRPRYRPSTDAQTPRLEQAGCIPYRLTARPRSRQMSGLSVSRGNRTCPRHQGVDARIGCQCWPRRLPAPGLSLG